MTLAPQQASRTSVYPVKHLGTTPALRKQSSAKQEKKKGLQKATEHCKVYVKTWVTQTDKKALCATRQKKCKKKERKELTRVWHCREASSLSGWASEQVPPLVCPHTLHHNCTMELPRGPAGSPPRVAQKRPPRGASQGEATA